VRQEVTDVRRADEEARTRENTLTRHIARLGAESAGAETRAQEAESRLEHLAFEQQELEAEINRLDEQGDLFAEQARHLADRLDSIRADKVNAETDLQALRVQEADARRALAEVEDEAGRLAARAEALAALEREYHGFAPPVAAALSARAELSGLEGPITEFLRLPAERAAAVEAALGSLLQMLVVQDGTAAQRVREWLAAHQADSGAVAILPREALPRLEALIAELEFAGNAPSEPVLMGRRDRLDKLRREAAAALTEVEQRAELRASFVAQIEQAEAALRERAALLHDVEMDLRRAEADEATRAGQRGRTMRAGEELERRRAELRDVVQRAQREAEEGRTERIALENELSAHRQRWQDATQALTEREAAWEAVRDEEAELRVAHARAEGTLAALERRMATAREELGETELRLGGLNNEEHDHRQSIEQLDGVRTEASERLGELFGERDSLSGTLRGLDERLGDAADAALSLETQVRTLRRSADERSEIRHRLELQRAEADAAERRVRDRLEAEWGRPFEQLAEETEPVTGDVEILAAELQTMAADIERLGPINMLAVEEHEEESRRLEFLQLQRDDLVKARDDLQSAIRQINRTARDMFIETFDAVRANFSSTFQTLFEGGECDIRLEDPEDPLESAIDISASPRGKRTQRIHLLSGGERALTALALLFAIYLVKPSPFCVLDEVDAPLDEANIGRFLTMLHRFKLSTQFVVITHNPRTMEAADWLYGVTMQEPGISSIVGVRLEEVLAGAAASATA
jgi:chromosome segregation protein